MYDDELFRKKCAGNNINVSKEYDTRNTGDNPFQRDDFLQTVRNYKKQGFSEKEIAEKLNITAKNRAGEDVPSVARLRIQISLAEDINRAKIVEKVEELRDQGKSLNQIAKELGLPNESSVRSYLNKESIKHTFPYLVTLK